MRRYRYFVFIPIILALLTLAPVNAHANVCRVEYWTLGYLNACYTYKLDGADMKPDIDIAKQWDIDRDASGLQIVEDYIDPTSGPTKFNKGLPYTAIAIVPYLEDDPLQDHQCGGGLMDYDIFKTLTCGYVKTDVGGLQDKYNIFGCASQVGTANEVYPRINLLTLVKDLINKNMCEVEVTSADGKTKTKVQRIVFQADTEFGPGYNDTNQKGQKVQIDGLDKPVWINYCDETLTSDCSEPTYAIKKLVFKGPQAASVPFEGEALIEIISKVKLGGVADISGLPDAVEPIRVVGTGNLLNIPGDPAKTTGLTPKDVTKAAALHFMTGSNNNIVDKVFLEGQALLDDYNEIRIVEGKSNIKTALQFIKAGDPMKDKIKKPIDASLIVWGIKDITCDADNNFCEVERFGTNAGKAKVKNMSFGADGKKIIFAPGDCQPAGDKPKCYWARYVLPDECPSDTQTCYNASEYVNMYLYQKMWNATVQKITADGVKGYAEHISNTGQIDMFAKYATEEVGSRKFSVTLIRKKGDLKYTTPFSITKSFEQYVGIGDLPGGYEDPPVCDPACGECYTCVEGQCQKELFCDPPPDDDESCQNVTCNEGFHCTGGACVADGNDEDDNTPTCEGTIDENGVCINNSVLPEEEGGGPITGGGTAKQISECENGDINWFGQCPDPLDPSGEKKKSGCSLVNGAPYSSMWPLILLLLGVLSLRRRAKILR